MDIHRSYSMHKNLEFMMKIIFTSSSLLVSGKPFMHSWGVRLRVIRPPDWKPYSTSFDIKITYFIILIISDGSEHKLLYKRKNVVCAVNLLPWNTNLGVNHNICSAMNLIYSQYYMLWSKWNFAELNLVFSTLRRWKVVRSLSWFILPSELFF